MSNSKAKLAKMVMTVLLTQTPPVPPPAHRCPRCDTDLPEDGRCRQCERDDRRQQHGW